MSVNDAFVMGAWARDQKTGDKVRMLADGSAEFAKATGLTLDLTARGMGVRSNRYSMLVKDGKVATLNVEGPGKFEVSDADDLAGPSQGAKSANARRQEALGRPLQVGFQVVRARDGVVIVGRYLVEAQVLVQGAGGFHVVQRIQQDARHSRLAARASSAASASWRPRPIERMNRAHTAASFRGVGIVSRIQRPDRAAARQFAVHLGRQQRPVRRGVLAWQLCQLLVELLEAQVYTQGLLVLAKQAAYGFDFFGSCGRDQPD